MDKKLKEILKKFSNNENTLDKVIVSTFIESNNICVKKNKLIKWLLIKDDDSLKEHINQMPFTFDDLVEVFESIIPENERTINWAVYTPNHIKDFIVQSVFKRNKKNITDLIVWDISCGCWAFLYTLSNHIKQETNKSFGAIFKDNIWWLDISKNSIKRAKILLSLLALSKWEDEVDFEFNLFVDNALSFDWNKISKIKKNWWFDIIVWNPPYVRAKNIDVNTKVLLKKWDITKSGNPDLYIPFFEIWLNYLKTDWILSYITVNTFYKSLNARAFRGFMTKKKYELAIIDFGDEKVFGNKSVYTCICFLSKKETENISFTKHSSKLLETYNKLKFTKIAYSSLDSEKGWLLSEKSIINNINKVERCWTALWSLYKIKNWIATLSNDIYIFKPIWEEGEYFILKQWTKKYKIEKAICRDIIKPNILKYEHEIEGKKEKIIYPYTNWISPLTLMKEANLKNNFPKAYKYLSDNRKLLQLRDKGDWNYENWFAFGRSQALSDKWYKLLFPYMGKKPFFVFTTQKDLLIYCWYAIFSESKEDLLMLKKILESSVFEYYINSTSKPYSWWYFSYAKNYIKNFNICKLNKKDKEYLIMETNKDKINKFLIKKYDIEIK